VNNVIGEEDCDEKMESSKLAIIPTKRYQLQRMMKKKELKMLTIGECRILMDQLHIIIFLHKLDAYLQGSRSVKNKYKHRQKGDGGAAADTKV